MPSAAIGDEPGSVRRRQYRCAGDGTKVRQVVAEQTTAVILEIFSNMHNIRRWRRRRIAS